MKLLFAIRALVLLGVIYLWIGSPYPPGRAQETKDESRYRDEQINNLKSRIDAEEALTRKQWDTVNAVRDSQTHMEGVTEGFGALLTLMVGGSITLQVRKRA